MIFLTGFILGVGLILGVGAQNIFVMKQAISREYAFTTAFMCVICDIILIIFSILLTTVMAHYLPLIKPIMLFAAVVFLIYYGAVSLKSSFSHERLFDKYLDSNQKQSLVKVIMLSVSFSLLNPQAILDLVILLGGVASKYSSNALKIEFMLGVSLASFVWFFLLVMLGIWLSKFIKSVRLWCWVERISAVMMFIIAINCIYLLL